MGELHQMRGMGIYMALSDITKTVGSEFANK